MSKHETVERGSGNVFADLGLPDAEERMAKALLSRLIDKTIDRRGLTQAQAADLLGCAQPDVSKIVRGQVAGFSFERLTRYVMLLGYNVELRVSEAEDAESGHLLVHA
jgi:predicted XRE-type DNA-binding protein